MSNVSWLNDHFSGQCPEYLCKALEEEEITAQESFAELNEGDLEDFIKTYRVKLGHRVILRKLHSKLNAPDDLEHVQLDPVSSASAATNIEPVVAAASAAANIEPVATAAATVEPAVAAATNAGPALATIQRSSSSGEEESETSSDTVTKSVYINYIYNLKDGAVPKEVISTESAANMDVAASPHQALDTENVNSWICKKCTMRSKKDHNFCDACGTKKPGYDPHTAVAGSAADVHFAMSLHQALNPNINADGTVSPAIPTVHSADAELAKTLHLSLNLENETAIWTCPVCSLQNIEHKNFCSACDTHKPDPKPPQTQEESDKDDDEECQVTA